MRLQYALVLSARRPLKNSTASAGHPEPHARQPNDDTPGIPERPLLPLRRSATNDRGHSWRPRSVVYETSEPVLPRQPHRVIQAAANLKISNLDVTVTPYDPSKGTQSWAQGGDVTVTATYPYSISLLGLVVKSGRMSSTTTERVE